MTGSPNGNGKIRGARPDGGSNTGWKNPKYGGQHKRMRAQLKPRVEAGLEVCARCGEWIAPGTPWDMGHDDENPHRHSGAEHAVCNRGTNGRGSTGPPPMRHSREW